MDDAELFVGMTLAVLMLLLDVAIAALFFVEGNWLGGSFFASLVAVCVAWLAWGIFADRSHG